MSEYISVTATATMIRHALKEAFPSIKFSVRSSKYSGGASIDVDWTDGPNVAQVDAITQSFAGSYFDGMTDYKGSRYHMLDGKRVHFGANFVFSHRQYSDHFIEMVIDNQMKWHDGDRPNAADWRTGKLYGKWFDRWCSGDRNQDMQTVIGQAACKRSTVIPLPCPTLGRLHYLGDDGCGYMSDGKAHLQLVTA